MASFTVLFYGICTNFRHVPQNPQLDRMVLVNGNAENIAYLASKLTVPIDIEPHVAQLWVESRKDDPILLTGVTITVENVVPGLQYPTELRCVPDLTKENLKHGKDIRPPEPRFVLDKDATASSCYFDFTGGTFMGCASSKDKAAAMTKVVVQTTDAAKSRLILTPFPNATGPMPPSVEVPDGGTVWMMNVPDDAQDDHDADFYLHYLTAKNIPGKPYVPSTTDCPTICGNPPKFPVKLRSHAYLVAGAGCSNSNFP